MSRDDYVQVSDPITSAAGTYRVRVDSDPYNNRSMPTDFAYVVEQECCAHDDCDCECWRETDRAGTGYESASDAMIAGRAAVPYEADDSIYTLHLTDSTLDCIERALEAYGDCLDNDESIDQAEHVRSIIREARGKQSDYTGKARRFNNHHTDRGGWCRWSLTSAATSAS